MNKSGQTPGDLYLQSTNLLLRSLIWLHLKGLEVGNDCSSSFSQVVVCMFTCY